MSTATRRADWDILQVEGVKEVCGRAARKVSDAYPHTVEYDDALQEAYLIVATGSTGWVAEQMSLGILHHRLHADLVDKVKTEGKHRSKHVSWEREREGSE